MKIVKHSQVDPEIYSGLTFSEFKEVRRIIEDVKKNGDRAVKAYTLRYDGVALKNPRVEYSAFVEAKIRCRRETIRALKQAAANIGTFAERQLSQLRDFESEIEPGVFAGQRVVPIERVGVYVPGGNFPLISSLLMGVVPARTAGVEQIVVCTPPGPDGQVHPAILTAAAIAGVDEMYSIGGVQAVAVMAYGCESVNPVDKIVGPGNLYVTAAKKEVYGVVGIDFIAGPSEVLILADESADPGWIAADLLAQAEHDTAALPWLITPSAELARAVNREIDRQLPLLETRDIAARSIERNGRIILTESLDQAVAFANRKAPEHLELHLREPQTIAEKCRNFGSLFIGSAAAEVLGDYNSGLNHTLPTGRAARYTGGLSVLDFVKVQTTLRVTPRGFTGIGPGCRHMARLEGLTGHANAVNIRSKGIKK